MSEWVKIRDAVLDVMKDGAMDVVEETKQAFLQNFIEAGIPVVEKYATDFVAKVKEQSKAESGWCKIRDSVVIPAAVQLVLFIGKQIIAAVAEKAKKEAATA